MQKLMASMAVAVCLAGTAHAQTYGDLYEAGTLGDVSNMEKRIGQMLVDNGVPMSCLALMTLNDVAQINGILNNAGMNSANKRNRIKAIVSRSC
ncbi:MAG: hypothetical protein AAGF74_12480 [Pseudomonadota bacterium]